MHNWCCATIKLREVETVATGSSGRKLQHYDPRDKECRSMRTNLKRIIRTRKYECVPTNQQ